MAPIPIFDESKLEAICTVLGDTSAGLTGTEIGRLLRACGIDDPYPTMTKRYRLFEALAARQRADNCGNLVIAFIQHSMDPVRYASDAAVFHDRLEQLNQVLVFAALTCGEDGTVRAATQARTLTDAQERAGRLKAALERRGTVHPDVLRACRAELVENNYFHAVLEAAKSLAEKIRSRTGLASDGAALIDDAFGFRSVVPYLALNSLQTETEQSEQSGFMNLLKGIFGHFRNPVSHAPRISWAMPEEDALDLLTFASYLHRRLDAAVRTPRS